MKLYLAGFDVFRPDARSHGQALKRLCAQFGCQGLYPLDNEAPAGLRGRALAEWIYAANIGLIRSCDAVVANLNPFRGAEPDSGTAFEVGYAAALGKPVWAYTSQRQPLVGQVACARDPVTGRHVDDQGYTVEDFGLNVNLMLACGAHIVCGGLRQCLEAVTASRG